MTRHEKLVEMFKSSKLTLYPGYDKNEKDLDAVAQLFEEDAKRYIRTVDQGRMICAIHSVSRSGMSRYMSFRSCEPVIGHAKNFYFRGFNQFISAVLGIRINERHELVVKSYLFETNYDVVNALQRIGYLSKKRAEILAQRTPTAV